MSETKDLSLRDSPEILYKPLEIVAGPSRSPTPAHSSGTTRRSAR